MTTTTHLDSWTRPGDTPIGSRHLDRVIGVINGKGGVGKTSVAVNLAAQLAAQDYSVLLCGLDPQDNAGEDLGYLSQGLGDDGANLANALRGSDTLSPLKDVRPGLDVVPGGDALEQFLAELHIRTHLGHDDSYALADTLADVADDYDVILIDAPPGYAALQHQVLVAARWMLVPTAVDASSRKGLARLADRLSSSAAYNDEIGLLGVVLFDVPVAASRIRDAALRAIRDDLGTDAPLFTASIRTAPAAAKDARDRGWLMHELAEEVRSAGPFWKRDKTAGPALAASARNVAADYKALMTEMLTVLVAAENTQQEES